MSRSAGEVISWILSYTDSNPVIVEQLDSWFSCSRRTPPTWGKDFPRFSARFPLLWGSITGPWLSPGMQCVLAVESAYPLGGLSPNRLLSMSAVLPFSDSMAMICAGIQTAGYASAPGACATPTWPGQTCVSLHLQACKLIADSPFAAPPCDFPLNSDRT